MGVYTMECFSYDDEFQREIYNKHPIWLQEQEEKRKATEDLAKQKKTSTKAAKKAKTTKTPVNQGRVPKRKRPVDLESEDELEYVYASSGTRTRPRHR